ncbi:MAG TPA: hypothetical protein VGH70_13510 [Bradyrhizobium sp.]
MGVIDELEAVEIEHQNCERLLFARPVELFDKPFFKKAAVGQPGQGIVTGEVARIELCGGARLDLARKVGVTAESVDQQRRTENEHHEKEVVDFPISVIQPELKQMGRQLISVRDGEGDKPDTEDDQCIAVFASVQIETAETESA